MNPIGELNPTQRILMGPGPSDVHPRVLRAMSAPCTGHLDPEFIGMMNDVQELLRYVFQTSNKLTIPISATGSAGMEACMVNVLEPGDHVVVGVNGVFGMRMSDIAERIGCDVTPIEVEWGRIIEPEQVQEAVNARATKLVGVVHAETSTGAHQPLEAISKITRDAGALFMVDMVTSLCGVEVRVDDWDIDLVYSGTQKCMSCPPGLSPVSFSERALETLRNRKTKVQSWYLDMTMIEKYWTDGDRAYHHTAPINMNYAIREALRIVQEEGLESRWARHQKNHEALAAGLSAIGIELSAQEGHRLPMLNAVKIPEGVDDAKVRSALLKEFSIEIGGGLGAGKGKLWRIGLMGESSCRHHVLYLLTALETLLAAEGVSLTKGAGVAAASEIYGAA
jgi:alanine-glyoxylate transaminase/serine-glyoxylate transaminase/serine-pyruvate transaminase